jgi:hypothetical protein
MLVYRAFVYVSFKDPPKKESSLQVSIAPIEKHVPFPQPYFICLSKSLVNEPLLQVTQRGPYGERFPFSEPPFTYLPESQ